jgi:hypothetical protein
MSDEDDRLSDGEIAAAVIGALAGFALLFVGLVFLFRIWMRGPTRGTDNKKKLDGKVVAITGTDFIHFNFLHQDQ